MPVSRNATHTLRAFVAEQKPLAEDARPPNGLRAEHPLDALLRAGADPNACLHPNQEHECPVLHAVAALRRPNWVRMLLEAGADPDRRDGRTKGNALHRVLDAQSAVLLLEAGTRHDVMTDGAHQSPLRLAVFAGRQDVARALLAHGADPTEHSTHEGSTLPMLSVDRKQPDILADLLLAGGQNDDRLREHIEKRARFLGDTARYLAILDAVTLQRILLTELPEGNQASRAMRL